MRIPAPLLSLVIGFVGATSTQAQLINTATSWDGVNAIAPFGEPGFATIGQVFTTDNTFTQLDAFAFALAYKAGGPVNYVGAVMAWDATDSHVTGPLLFASGPLSIPTSASNFTATIIPTGGIQLAPSTQYVAFLTTSPLFDGVPDAAQIGFVGSDVYSGGGAVALNNGSDLSALSNSTWLSTPADLVFVAAFSSSPVPEPSSYGLMGVGALAAIIWLRRRFRRE